MNKAVRAVFYEEYESLMVHTVNLYRRHDLINDAKNFVEI
jgi:hypothetical protein